MKRKRISKVGERLKKEKEDSQRQLEKIQQRVETAETKEKKKRSYKKKSVKSENDFDVGDIEIDIDEQLQSSKNIF